MKYRLGLIGHPVAHSLSPPMHLAALAHCGLPGTYELIDLAPQDLRAGVQRLIDEGYNGFNVTIPHKEAVYEMADERTDWVEAARACNTVKIVEGRMHAHNTDIAGFTSALKKARGEGEIRSCCILGTGGAARAALLGVACFRPTDIVILSREQSRADRLRSEFLTFVLTERTPADESLKDVLERLPSPSHLVARTHAQLSAETFDVIVNCAPLGQNGVPMPDWVNDVITRLDESGLLFDMVYAKTESESTPLVERVHSQDKKAVDGAEMLIIQAQRAFQVWTERFVPADVFRKAFRRAQNERLL